MGATRFCVVGKPEHSSHRVHLPGHMVPSLVSPVRKVQPFGVAGQAGQRKGVMSMPQMPALLRDGSPALVRRATLLATPHCPVGASERARHLYSRFNHRPQATSPPPDPLMSVTATL